MIYLKKFNETYSNDYSDDETVNANSKFDSIKTDLTSKFGELNFSTDHKEFLKTAIYNYISEIEIISRQNDGALMKQREVNATEEELEEFLDKTTEYISELKSFFKKIKK